MNLTYILACTLFSFRRRHESEGESEINSVFLCLCMCVCTSEKSLAGKIKNKRSTKLLKSRLSSESSFPPTHSRVLQSELLLLLIFNEQKVRAVVELMINKEINLLKGILVYKANTVT